MNTVGGSNERRVVGVMDAVGGSDAGGSDAGGSDGRSGVGEVGGEEEY